ncbi:MAG: type IV pilus assembly protein PilM [Patescibacteria group bacterium]|nr:type IV pilus assembly protein PilM [Patescibacteria group bacterium]
MFSLFSRKNKCLGVDIGTTGVKIVELKKENNVPVLSNYALSYDSGSLIQTSGLEILDGQSSEIIRNVLKRGKFSTKRAVVAIPSFLALISFVELPEMPRAELDQAVRFEANKYIPTPLDEVSLGWDIIGSYQEKPIEGSQAIRQNNKIQIMVVTVPKSSIESITKVIEKNGLVSSALEVENFATTRCLIGNDKGTFMIVNIGAKATNFTIVSDGIIRVTRSIDVGGVEISRAIASGLRIDLQRADKFKRSNQINLLDVKDRTSSLVAPVAGMILDEIKRLRELYHKKNPLRKIEKLIFTGGTSKMNSLLEYFSRQMSLECQLGNSLARVGVEKKYENVVKEVAPELTVAIGLALRGLQEK